MSDKGLDKAELIKWWDVLDTLTLAFDKEGAVEEGVRMTRECRHPDAVWLATLFPAGAAVTWQSIREAMEHQREDPRALHVAWMLGYDEEEHDLLERAAAKGYAPAQADLSAVRIGSRAFELAQQAAAQGSRRGMCQLGRCFRYGRGCAKDEHRAIELFRAAAELGDGGAQEFYGKLAFGEMDWERFHWWSLGVARGFGQYSFRVGTVHLLEKFEKGKLGRILHIAAPVLKANLNVVVQEVFGISVGKEVWQGKEVWPKLLRVLELHEAMLKRVRCAIACWSIVGRRRGVAKDMRVMIAKMLWEEPWRWGEKNGGAQGTNKAQ
jgi:hypothetical protein